MVDFKNVFKYLTYMLIITALFIGLEMVKMINAKTEIPKLLISAHSHSLCMAFLALIIWLDLKTRDLEKVKFPYRLDEISLGVVVIGAIGGSLGLLLMGYNQFALGGILTDIGEPLLLLGVFLFLIASLIVDILK